MVNKLTEINIDIKEIYKLNNTECDELYDYIFQDYYDSYLYYDKNRSIF
jgi:hypothetical protein